MEAPLILVGCGNMGFALLRGWITSGLRRSDSVHVVEPSDALRERAASLGVRLYSSSEELGSDLKPDLIVLAVKPQIIAEVAPAYARFRDEATYISLAAGVDTARLAALLGDAAILRIMPNTPTAVGKGSTVIFANDRVESGRRQAAADLLHASGKVHFIDQEDLMDPVTALSGSGPGYVFLFIECLARRAAALGLPENLALDLARETVFGAAALAMNDTTVHPQRLREMVTSPNGTTAAGLDALLADNVFEHAINAALIAARDRSIAISQSS